MFCSQCQKPQALCVCSEITPTQSKLQVLILQHPQEPDHEIGSARLAHLALPNSKLNIGLSWRNLAAALDNPKANSTHWAVLYLGSGVKGEDVQVKPLQFVSQKGNPVNAPAHLDGVVILDGTWSQAKALWWRNPWLLKLKRVILTPRHPSLYKELRKEPRRECLSTIESIAEVLELLGEPPQLSEHLRGLFAKLLDKRRKGLKATKLNKTPLRGHAPKSKY